MEPSRLLYSSSIGGEGRGYHARGCTVFVALPCFGNKFDNYANAENAIVGIQTSAERALRRKCRALTAAGVPPT